MLYTLCIILILVSCILVILAVLVQNPKSGMAANFGASNQVMGVRQTSDFLEKFTWTMAGAIVVLSLIATLAMDRALVGSSNTKLDADAQTLIENTTPMGSTGALDPAAEPASTETAPASPAASTEAAPATAE